MKKINYLTIYIVKMSDLSIYIGKIYHDSFNVFCSYCAADNFFYSIYSNFFFFLLFTDLPFFTS